MGLKYWNDASKGNFDQSNNAYEAVIGKVYYGKAMPYLESCSAASFSSVHEAGGMLDGVPKYVQPEDYYMSIINNPDNVPALKAACDFDITWVFNTNLPINRYIEAWYALGRLLYPNNIYALSSDLTEVNIQNTLSRENTGIMFLLKKPQHFIGAHNYKDGLVYYNDSYKQDSFNPSLDNKRSLNLKDFVANLNYKMLIITKGV